MALSGLFGGIQGHLDLDFLGNFSAVEWGSKDVKRRKLGVRRGFGVVWMHLNRITNHSYVYFFLCTPQNLTVNTFSNNTQPAARCD